MGSDLRDGPIGFASAFFRFKPPAAGPPGLWPAAGPSRGRRWHRSGESLSSASL